MANNSSQKLNQLLILIFVVVIAGASYYFWLNYGKKPKKTSTPTNSVSTKSLVIKKDVYLKLIQPHKPNPFTPPAPGFGRENPFIPYK